MPRREKKLLARDTKRNIGEELLQAIRDVKAGRHGAKYDATAKTHANDAPKRRKAKTRGEGAEVRHVTKPGANLFLELGFSPEEAKRLLAASRKQINDTRLLKEQLMSELANWIEQHHLKQAEAAEILMVSRARVSDVVNKNTAKLTIDTLVEMLSRVGKPVRLAIG